MEQEQEINKKKLFIGSLNYDTAEKALEEYFSGAGTVESVTIITDKMSGRSKGFGFVEMSSEEEAEKAVEMFNGKDIEDALNEMTAQQFKNRISSLLLTSMYTNKNHTQHLKRKGSFS